MLTSNWHQVYYVFKIFNAQIIFWKSKNNLAKLWLELKGQSSGIIIICLIQQPGTHEDRLSALSLVKVEQTLRTFIATWYNKAYLLFRNQKQTILPHKFYNFYVYWNQSTFSYIFITSSHKSTILHCKDVFINRCLFSTTIFYKNNPCSNYLTIHYIVDLT